jgi:flagella basal body P-ring formation protein FlgA
MSEVFSNDFYQLNHFRFRPFESRETLALSQWNYVGSSCRHDEAKQEVKTIERARRQEIQTFQHYKFEERGRERMVTGAVWLGMTRSRSNLQNRSTGWGRGDNRGKGGGRGL